MEGRFYEDPTKFNDILANCKKNKQKFTDPDFTPTDDHIVDPNDIVDDLGELGPVTWRRAPDIPDLNDKARMGKSKLHVF